MSTQSPAEALTRSFLSSSPRGGPQRRRREVALTAKWLRELRGTKGPVDDVRPAGHLIRPAEHEVA